MDSIGVSSDDQDFEIPRVQSRLCVEILTLLMIGLSFHVGGFCGLQRMHVNGHSSMNESQNMEEALLLNIKKRKI